MLNTPRALLNEDHSETRVNDSRIVSSAPVPRTDNSACTPIGMAFFAGKCPYRRFVATGQSTSPI